MNLLSKLTLAISLILLLSSCNAQVKNSKTALVKIYGNCEMCKKTIETAGNLKKEAKVVWDKTQKTAIITYDSTKTNQEEILKRIALSGYDNEKFLAPDDIYAKLPKCCHYERKAKTVTKTETPAIDTTKTEVAVVDNIKTEAAAIEDTKTAVPTPPVMPEPTQQIPPLKAVFASYFTIKDALVNTDGSTASTLAKEMLTTIHAVKMENLSTEEHPVWMKVVKELSAEAAQIAGTTDISHQREHFIALSKNVYDLIKVSKQETPTYFQHCPMYNDGKGADWLSKENTIKNPYYGAEMLRCGKTVETIQ